MEYKLATRSCSHTVDTVTKRCSVGVGLAKSAAAKLLCTAMRDIDTNCRRRLANNSGQGRNVELLWSECLDVYRIRYIDSQG